MQIDCYSHYILFYMHKWTQLRLESRHNIDPINFSAWNQQYITNVSINHFCLRHNGWWKKANHVDCWWQTLIHLPEYKIPLFLLLYSLNCSSIGHGKFDENLFFCYYQFYFSEIGCNVQKHTFVSFTHFPEYKFHWNNLRYGKNKKQNSE